MEDTKVGRIPKKFRVLIDKKIIAEELNITERSVQRALSDKGGAEVSVKTQNTVLDLANIQLQVYCAQLQEICIFRVVDNCNMITSDDTGCAESMR